MKLYSLVTLLTVAGCQPKESVPDESQDTGGMVVSSGYQRSSSQSSSVLTATELNPLLSPWDDSMIPKSSQSPKVQLPLEKLKIPNQSAQTKQSKVENRYYQSHTGQLSILYAGDTSVNSISTGQTSPQQSRSKSSGSSVSGIKRIVLSVRAVEVHSVVEGWLLAADFSGRNRDVELSASSNGPASGLAGLLLEQGNYTQVRLVLGESNSVYLDENGAEVAHPLVVPSGQESGLKLIQPFKIVDDGVTVFTLKFDIEKSVVYSSGHGYLLNPVVKIDSANTSGSISQTISGGKGGTIEIMDLATLQIFPEIVEGDVTISMQMVDCCDTIPNVPIIGPVIDFGPDGMVFENGPALLTFSYDPDLLQIMGIGESELGVYYFDEDSGKWLYIGGKVDEDNKTITALVTHFSLLGYGYYDEILYDGSTDMPIIPDYQNTLGDSFKFPSDISSLSDRGWQFYKKFNSDPKFNVPTTHQYPFAQKEDGCSGFYSPTEVRDTFDCKGRIVDFSPTCNKHDRCYYTRHTTSSQCNDPFGADLRTACLDDLAIPYNYLDFSGRTQTGYVWDYNCLKSCEIIATLMEAVVIAGEADFHGDAQKKQDDYQKWTIQLIEEFNYPPNCNLSVMPKIGTTKSYIDLFIDFQYKDEYYLLKNTNVNWQHIAFNQYRAEVESGFYSVTVYSPDQTSTDRKEATCSVTVPGVNSLNAYHSGCDSSSKSDTAECIAAVRRACNALGYGMGLPQEVGSSALAVGCFNPVAYGNINFSILRTYHDGCDSAVKSQTAECAAAARRFCSNNGFNQGGVLGEPQEVGSAALGIGCFVTEQDISAGKAWYGDISITELSQHHSECNSEGLEQTPPCTAAVHRACVARGFNMGTPQEVGNGVFGVGCFNAPYYGEISVQ